MPDNKDLKKEPRDSSLGQGVSKEQNTEIPSAESTLVDIDPDAFAGLEGEEGRVSKEVAEPEAAIEAGPLSTVKISEKEPVIIPPAEGVAPQLPPFKVEGAESVVEGNLASITAAGVPLSTHKERIEETFKGIQDFSQSAHESAAEAARLLDEHEAAELPKAG